MFKKKSNVKNSPKYTNLDNLFTTKEGREKYFEGLDREGLENECLNQMTTYDRLITIIDKQRDDLNKYIEYYNNEINKLVNYYNNEIDKQREELQFYKDKYDELHTIETLSDYYLCNICCVNPKNLIFQPCNHFSLCDGCYFNLLNLAKQSMVPNQELDDDGNINSSNTLIPIVKCPLCREDIKDIKNIFY
jgi:hypothetical protein